MNTFIRTMLALIFFATSCAMAQTMPYYADVSDPSDLSPTLIGGTIADPADWPASPWVGNCSSTLIGERTLLTAAHCVSNGSSKSFTIGSTRYSGACSHHTSYRGNQTADWSLCLLTQPVESVKFESVATSAEAGCSVGAKYLWTGYGCTRWGGGVDGKFRTGLVGTTRCPSGNSYDTVTRGSVALCSGDSGGGGYVLLSNGDRRVIGVNSRSNTTDTSYVSSTYSDSFRTWAKSWADGKNTKICGIHVDALNCRGGVAPDPDPSDCSDELRSVTSTLSAHGSAVASLKSCLEN